MIRVRTCNMGPASRRIRHERCDMIVIGDSLDTRSTNDRSIIAMHQAFKPDSWRGQYATTIPWNNSGVGEFALISNNIAGTGASSVQVRMGEDPPGTAPRGLNLRPFSSFAFAGDFQNFYQYLCEFRMPTTDAATRYNPQFFYDFLRNVNAKVGMLFISSSDSIGTNAGQIPLLAAYNRAGTRHDAGRAAIDPNANPGTLQYVETSLCALGTGTANNNSVRGELQFMGENETGLRFHPVQFRIYVPDQATGLSINFCAQGGATVKSHLAAGDTITADGVEILSGYTDAGMQAECGYCGYNLGWFKLGTNSAGSTVAQYALDMEAAADRWINAMTLAGQNPLIVLETPHPTDTSGRFEGYADALEVLCRRRGWGLVDTYGECMRQFGSVAATISQITASGYGPIVGVTDTDAIHYSVYGVEWRARNLWRIVCESSNDQPPLSELVLPKPRSRQF